MQQDNVIPRFGDENFLSFDQISDTVRPPSQIDWTAAVHQVRNPYLQGIEMEGIEGPDIKILRYFSHSHGFKLGIPVNTTQGEIERALYALVTIAEIRNKLANNVKKKPRADVINAVAGHQIERIEYSVSSTKRSTEAEPDSHYQQYAEQIKTVILAVRDNALTACVCTTCGGTGKINKPDDFFAADVTPKST